MANLSRTLVHILRSAGVLLAMATPMLATSQGLPKWSATRELRIDGEAQNLVPVAQIRVDSSGRMFAMQRQDLNIRVFKSDGTPERTIGRKGSGPGEFENLEAIGLFGDTLWALDGQREQVSYFGADQKPLRTIRIKDVIIGRVRHDPVVYSLHRSNSIVALITNGSQPTDRSLALVRATAEGVLKGTFATRTYPQGTGFSFSNYDGGNWKPYGDHNPPMWATSDNGERIGVATTALSGENAGSGMLTMHNFNGDTLFTRRFPVTLKPIPDEVIDSRLAELAKNPNYANLIRDVPRPEFYPPLEYMRVARNGAVLLAFYAHSPERDFLMINSAGSIVASLVLPKNFIVKYFEGDLLWGVERDDNDVESIVRYRIVK